MKQGAKSFILPAAVLIAGFCAVFFLSNFLERNRVKLPESYDDADLVLQGKRLKGFALGSEGLLADWYWMRSLQYVGDKLAKSDLSFINVDDLRSLNPRLLYPYLDNATDLDPKFIAAYTYGAMVLPAIDPDQAIRLVEKGIANNPEYWRLYQYLGYIHWRLKDYEASAQAYEKGSLVPGAAPFMKMMVAATKTQGGSRETARAIYRQMLEEAQDEQTKISSEFRLMELESLDERDLVNAALDNFKARSGRCPGKASEIFPLLGSTKLPSGNNLRVDKANSVVDPYGLPYIIDPADCRLKPGPESRFPRY